MPFVMLLLLDKSKICKQMVSMLLYLIYGSQDLLDDIFQGILTSPEMCLKRNAFCKILTDKNFSKNICAVIVDEAHCISQWGEISESCMLFSKRFECFFLPTSHFWPSSAFGTVRCPRIFQLKLPVIASTLSHKCILTFCSMSIY